MEKSYAEKYHQLEEIYWWFHARRDMIYKLIKDYGRDVRILEVGCSGGALLKFLKKQGFKKLYGIDIDKDAIEICRQKDISDVSVADAEKTAFKDQKFDLIIASDILEHIREEDRALLEWNRILKPGGRLFIFVPAFKFLWSQHDKVNRHYRRYSKAGLIEILEKNGFRIEKVSYWNFSLFLPATLIRLTKKLFARNGTGSGDQLYGTPGFINKTLEYVLGLENRLLSGGINLPVGISLFAVARKL
ncbi:MAG: class I SAM-dependent methyltransferase [Nitrospirota bacterium]